MSFSWNSLWKATLTEEDEDAYSAIKHMHVNSALKRQLDDRKKVEPLEFCVSKAQDNNGWTQKSRLSLVYTQMSLLETIIGTEAPESSPIQPH